MNHIPLYILLLSILATALSCAPEASENNSSAQKAKQTTSLDQKKQSLTPLQYHIACEGGTEAPFTGNYLYNKEKGIYKCVVCGHDLFASDAKFDSGTGWPSYTQPFSQQAVRTSPDNSLGMQRTEVICQHCGAHLGHVFPDGPAPTRQRYCINSASLTFEKQEDTTRDSPQKK